MPKEDKESCIFCKIIEGNSPVSKVYEDEKVLVLVDIQPVNPGHLLVIPKVHAPYMSDLDVETAGHVMKIAHKMGAAVRKSKYKCEGVNLFLADGETALQEVFHYHFHIIPRFEGDGFGIKHDPSKNFIKLPREELDEIAAEIKKHV